MIAKQFVTVSVHLEKDEKALILQRTNRATFLPEYWEQAGGKIEQGEHPYQAAKREVLEETGLNIEVLSPYFINFYQMDGGWDMIEIALIGKLIDRKEIILSDEHQSYRWVTRSELQGVAPLSNGMRGVIEKGFDSLAV